MRFFHSSLAVVLAACLPVTGAAAWRMPAPIIASSNQHELHTQALAGTARYFLHDDRFAVDFTIHRLANRMCNVLRNRLPAGIIDPFLVAISVGAFELAAGLQGLLTAH